MKLFEKGEFGILWPFYLAQLTYAILFMFMPYMVIYFLDIGLSFFHISILMAVYTITPIIFEVPTGAIADTYGRKFSVILSYVLMGIFISLVFFTNNLYLLILIFFCLSVSATLSSGSEEAWIVDLLKYKRKKNLIQDYYTKSYSITSFGVVIMGILSALFVKTFGIKSTWIISGVGLIIAGLILINAKENFKREYFDLKKNISNTLISSKKSLIYSFKHKILSLLLFASFFATFAFAISQNMWQPFLENEGLKPYLLGYVYSGISVLTIFTPFLSKPLLKKAGKEKYVFVLISFITFLLFLAVYYANVILVAIAIMILIGAFDSVGSPIFSTFFQKFIPSKIRATVGSVNSMFLGIAATIGFLLGGLLADNVGPQMTIVYSAFFLIPTIIFYSMIKEKG